MHKLSIVAGRGHLIIPLARQGMSDLAGVPPFGTDNSHWIKALTRFGILRTMSFSSALIHSAHYFFSTPSFSYYCTPAFNLAWYLTWSHSCPCCGCLQSDWSQFGECWYVSFEDAATQYSAQDAKIHFYFHLSIQWLTRIWGLMRLSRNACNCSFIFC